MAVVEGLEVRLDALTEDFEGKIDATRFKARLAKWVAAQKEDNFSESAFSGKIVQMALDNVDIDAPNWTYVAARELLNGLYRDAAKNRGYALSANGYGSFYELVEMLSKPLDGNEYPTYKSELLAAYTKEEIETIGSFVDAEKDKLFSYIGLFLLSDRYLATPVDGKVYELPQERFLIIAMDLMRLEKPERRLELIKEAYWALSNLFMTVATPTLSNAGKASGQLSSCFIDVMGDSIEGIYLNNFDTAKVSKNGGGVGVYIGKVRGQNSKILGKSGKSSGIVPWSRLLNQTAVSVDQMGQRKGAIALYLDVWHIDIEAFLQLKTNNGDERMKAHDIFQGVCIPDLFMERLKEVGEDGRSIGEWYLFDPHVTSLVLGFRLEDAFDEQKGSGTFREQYKIAEQAARDGLIPAYAFKKIRAMDIMSAIMKAQLETGSPYMFYRDTVNRANPNKHKGLVYCSNLC